MRNYREIQSANIEDKFYFDVKGETYSIHPLIYREIQRNPIINQIRSEGIERKIFGKKLDSFIRTALLQSTETHRGSNSYRYENDFSEIELRLKGREIIDYRARKKVNSR